MTNERFLELQDEIQELREKDKQTSDRVQHELNVMDEKDDIVYIKKLTSAYHQLKFSDLPLYKKYIGVDSVWFYKLAIVDGKQKCFNVKVGDNRAEVLELSAHNILDPENVDSNEDEWMLACAELLNTLMPNKKNN